LAEETVVTGGAVSEACWAETGGVSQAHEQQESDTSKLKRKREAKESMKGGIL
jgi:hypothetical protein